MNTATPHPGSMQRVGDAEMTANTSSISRVSQHLNQLIRRTRASELTAGVRTTPIQTASRILRTISDSQRVDLNACLRRRLLQAHRFEVDLGRAARRHQTEHNYTRQHCSTGSPRRHDLTLLRRRLPQAEGMASGDHMWWQGDLKHPQPVDLRGGDLSLPTRMRRFVHALPLTLALAGRVCDD